MFSYIEISKTARLVLAYALFGLDSLMVLFLRFSKLAIFFVVQVNSYRRSYFALNDTKKLSGEHIAQSRSPGSE